MSEVENKYTIESLWILATHFTLEEGGLWMEKIPGQAFGTVDFHALKFNSTCEWDVINGFRTFEYPGDRDDDSELVQPAFAPDPSWPDSDFIGLGRPSRTGIDSAESASSTDGQGSEESELVTVHYAHCCSGSTKYCDCVNKNHGTALMTKAEAGEDYLILQAKVSAEPEQPGDHSLTE